MYKELRRSKEDRILAGVCSGIGLYTGIDPVLVRLIWAVGTFFSLGTGLLIYLIAWIIIPEE
ncbi:PspC domain-containing protein [Methanolobus sediminis]|uniref:PspC domain-containing protein n=1 Tax=Methanolobus sediminis TaxID=3072978 RepID=A0AA51ULF5_9EURY|nr:PspC domain-containing protein [Methanolobus sediminis]WMW25746.1 PspC domain-containing protein [Methanolobus sediminis]